MGPRAKLITALPRMCGGAQGEFTEVRTLENWLLLGPDTMDPLLILGVVLVAGIAGGWAATRARPEFSSSVESSVTTLRKLLIDSWCATRSFAL